MIKHYQLQMILTLDWFQGLSPSHCLQQATSEEMQRVDALWLIFQLLAQTIMSRLVVEKIQVLAPESKVHTLKSFIHRSKPLIFLAVIHNVSSFTIY